VSQSHSQTASASAVSSLPSKQLTIARITAFVLACCWFFYSLWLVVKVWGTDPQHEVHIYKIQQAIAWGVWTIATPVWFLFEYYLFNRENPNPPKGLVQRFKYNQTLAGKCWLAVAAVFLALFFGRLKP
jgi:hypothetical protein